MGISLGVTLALQAAEHERDTVKAVVAISPDAHTASSDAAVFSLLRAQSVIEKTDTSSKATVILAPDAGHMAHFYRPEVVRSIADTSASIGQPIRW